MVEHNKIVIEMDQPPARRGRGRPRKPPGQKKSHDAAFYADIRLRRELATIIHKQFRLQQEDIPEAQRLLKHLTDKATAAFHEITREIRETVWEEKDEGRVRDPSGKFVRVVEPDEVDELGMVLEPPAETAQAAEPQAVPLDTKTEKATPKAPERAEKRSTVPIKERGKLKLKAFR